MEDVTRIERDAESRTVIHAPRRFPPGVILINPKYEHNLGGVVRACSCFGISEVLWTGERIRISEDKRVRLPREERMKGYKGVRWERSDKPFDLFRGAVPVAIELAHNSQPLTTFEHPEEAVYVFGPEDGSITQSAMGLCHQFAYIPSNHCLNLSAAVNVVLAHRRMQRQARGLEPITSMEDCLKEKRGAESPAMDSMGWDGR